MKAIFKYEITPGTSDYEMPAGSELLYAREQGDSVCVWALVDPKEDAKESKSILVFGTGHPIPDLRMRPLGAAHLEAGCLVFHVFEVFEAT